MKIKVEDRGPLLKDIQMGMIQRDHYPDLFTQDTIRVIQPGFSTPEAPEQTVITIPEHDRRRLAAAVIRGTVDPADFPYLGITDGSFDVIYPDWDQE
jgi:hypothetical protein